MKSLRILSLAAAIALVGLSCDPIPTEQHVDTNQYDYDGVVTFTQSAPGSLLLLDSAGVSTALSGGNAHLNLTYNSSYWTGPNAPQGYTYYDAIVELTVDGHVFNFKVPARTTGFFNQTFFVSPAESGQPLVVLYDSASTVVSVTQRQAVVSCTVSSCSGSVSSCSGSKTRTTTINHNRSDVTLSVGTPASTVATFTAGATFKGSYFFESETNSDGPCR